ncbi:hypothetical protein [Thermoflavimicrobium daqui]|jgi:hypothetical protein|uniref:Uncharacterized protein n=1 Tax=Thermoflavimicrobium daqui TaxID=2137476 RepID=A0A364K430_9BACL|nr:hypothetical protein [Thermoflavimicrobium daqui]RAL24134.1 hypothetical protein DL897_10620 [Thermoflavimicrobium daqui]
MFELICTCLSFIIANVLFNRTHFCRKLTTWKSLLVSILVISASIFLFQWVGSTHYLIIIIPTVFCSVLVFTRYHEYLVAVQEKFQAKYQKEG